MKEKISVITTVYNTEKYLKKCLDSLINQTYENIEIIVVEDCSTDNSKKILEEYKNYNNIKIIYNDKNSGLSYSRNKGLEYTTGNYISYIDSDDYIDLDYYEKMMTSITLENADLAICDIKVVAEDGMIIRINEAINEGKVNALNIINNGLASASWNKIYKKELISKYQFEVGKINEDIAVVIPTVLDASKIVYVKDCYYHYVQRNNSIQNSRFNQKKFDIFDGVENTLTKIKENENYEQIKEILVFNQLITFLLYVIPKVNNFKERYQILKKYHKLSKKYDIAKNRYFKNFLDTCSRKYRIYYKLLLELNAKGLILFDDLLIAFYNLLAKFLKKKVKELGNIKFSDLRETAKKQSMMQDEKLKLSVVIPNYNYEKFLIQRIYSILNQEFKIYELIILDDCSNDNSLVLIDEIEKGISKYVKVKKVYNKENSGSAFKQWKKGFELATGDYIWIAEADDYCDKNLIRTIINPCLKDDNIKISYADTAFMDSNGNIVMKTIKNEIDIQKSKHWDKSFINIGTDEIKNYAYLNCTIANVSSCIIKKDDNYLKYLDESASFKQAGDWLFYLKVMNTGKIAYSNKTLNYYRLHGNNVSSIFDKEKHIDEIKTIHNYCMDNFKLDNKHKKKMEERIDYLEGIWKLK